MEQISSGASTSKEIDTSPESETGSSIRKCRAEDLDQISEIERTSFPSPYDKSIFSHFLTRSSDGFLVAERYGRIIGYMIFTIERNYGLIVSIAVSPDERRRGIGSKLLENALNELVGKVKTVELQVSVKNREGIEFYRKFSFHQREIWRAYYPNGEDAILMSREI